MTPHAHRGRPAVGVNAEPMGVQNLYIIQITTGFPWYIPISIFQMNTITRNKINTHIKNTSYDSLRCLLSFSILVTHFPITES